MSTFTDRIFSFKESYEFEALPLLSLEDFLSNELVLQLQDLEEQWVQLDLRNWSSQRTFSEEIQYRCSLERICFRLEEIIRFLESNKGPRIIRYVCSEILDFLRECKLTNGSISQEKMKQVEHILVVMNSFFQPEVSKLHLTEQSEVANLLKQATENILNRFSGKNREESLRTLSIQTPGEQNDSNE